MMVKHEEIILILDFGSQYTHLIKSSLSKLGANSIIEPADITLLEFKNKFPNSVIKGLILSGGAYSVNQNKIPFDKNWLSISLPILGICYGHQLIVKMLGGSVKNTDGEYGSEKINWNTDIPLFSETDSDSTVWMSHSDSAIKLPNGFVSIASTKDFKNSAIYSASKAIYGLQFHPEVSHTTQGVKILNNFAFKICNIQKSKTWTPEMFVKNNTGKYKALIGHKKIILGLSGGVDSSTLVAFLRSFLDKDQLIATYVDSGFDPSNTKDDIVKFCKKLDISLKTIDSSNKFFSALEGVTDPNTKRVIIGNVFIKEFETVAKAEKAKIFAQGTIWSDVIESGTTKFSSNIKPHHNVGGLPKHLKFELIEPFRELFKDQVRSLATYLKLPNLIVEKAVFPGPGYAIRVEGIVTPEKIKIVRRCTEIINEVMLANGLTKDFMCFAIYIDVKSSGIKGDMRVTNDHAIVVRIVETSNLLTANFSKKAFPYLEEISNRIIKETNTGKVLYDITNKPPSTIDWQ